MIPFEGGYNRRSGLQEPDTDVIEPEMRVPQSVETTVPSSRESVEESTETTDNTALAASATATTPIAYVPPHDPRNQLSSLVKNAQANKEALQQRGQWVKHSKEMSKREYGW